MSYPQVKSYFCLSGFPANNTGMKLFRFLLGSAVVAGLLLCGVPAAMADALHVWPVNGPVVRGFDPPEVFYASGHRGIDIAADTGTPVVSAAAGVVTFAGTINYVPMLTVTHDDGVRTTYQPVTPAVAQGDQMAAGAIIGYLQPGHCTSPCLHFGVLRGRDYLDPLQWLGPADDIRLLPAGSTVPALTTTTMAATAMGWPVNGRVTSEYGWRMHPILHKLMFHDGIDIAASCGTTVVAPWMGVVKEVGNSSSAGRFVRVAHGAIVTSYLHLSAIEVKVGDRLAGGQQVGKVGTTGLSTGCHLHFGASQNGVSINPRSILS